MWRLAFLYDIANKFAQSVVTSLLQAVVHPLVQQAYNMKPAVKGLQGRVVWIRLEPFTQDGSGCRQGFTVAPLEVLRYRRQALQQ
jgi:hypothetical protein